MERSIVWFRNDLRIEDNKSLSEACKSSDLVIGVYFLDPEAFEIGKFGFKKTEKFRAKFLLETLQELRGNLKKLNISLLVIPRKPASKLAELVERFKITSIYIQTEWTQEETNILKEVTSTLPEHVNVKGHYNQFLYHPEDIPFDSFQNIPQVFTEFRKKCEKYSEVRPVISIPEKFPKENLLSDVPNLPTLNELGFENFETDPRSAFPFKGGEDQAKIRMKGYFWNTKKLAVYKKTRNGLLGKDYSSKFSPWLANGSISPTLIYREVKRFEEEVTKNEDTYWLVFELLWRDFFKYISLKHGNEIFKVGGILKKEYSWGNDEHIKDSWIQGETTENFVNANMKELAQTGFMSNRGRQNACSFWSKVLQQDWRIGAAYFESMLIDYDVHSNWGNWMYNSGVGNDPRDRKFNIKSQAERYDPAGKYQQTWLQERLF
ncbi:MAG: DASH family cryptochrome [Bacteroidota bacterium]